MCIKIKNKVAKIKVLCGYKQFPTQCKMKNLLFYPQSGTYFKFIVIIQN